MQKWFLVLPLISTSLFGAQECAPKGPALCHPDDCRNCYCLGPDNVLANAPVSPRTCDGDIVVEIAGLYWKAQQDGMEYALLNQVENPGGVDPFDIREQNNLVDAKYLTPKFGWDFGFKAGIGYNSSCDGWDFGVLWTGFHGSVHSKIESDPSENQTLLPIWSAFAPGFGFNLYTHDIESSWDLHLNLVDLEMGRKFWTSKYLELRPFVGLRIARIDQDFTLEHKGGSWQEVVGTPFNATGNHVDLRNDFKGVGIRSGLDTTWNFGCGWALYSNLAASILYGKFALRHDEMNRETQAPFPKTKILETEESFRASRALVDLGLGLQWSGLFCSCKYGLTIALGWEEHLFFHQNQLWRVVRNGAVAGSFLPNNTGENIFSQSSGTLDTQGITLSIQFEF